MSRHLIDLKTSKCTYELEECECEDSYCEHWCCKQPVVVLVVEEPESIWAMARGDQKLKEVLCEEHKQIVEAKMRKEIEACPAPH